MPISQEMLDILCCPVTKVPVKMLEENRLEILNKQIAAGKVKDAIGDVISDPISEALITTDNKTIYRIDGDIPVMLVGSGIPAEQLEGF